MAQTEEAGARKEVVVDVAVVAAAPPHGWMSHVKFAAKKATPPKIVGGVLMKIMNHMKIRR
jgi:hypothetical protein